MLNSSPNKDYWQVLASYYIYVQVLSHPVMYFQLRTNMRTACIVLCIFARSVTYGKQGKVSMHNGSRLPYGKYGMVSMHNASSRTCALRNIFSWLRTCELLTSNYAYILFQSLSLTSQDAYSHMNSMYSKHNGSIWIVCTVSIMDHLTLNLRPKEYFSAGSEHANCLHRTMHIYEFKVCHSQDRTL